MKLNEIRRSDYVELDFDARYTIDQIKDCNITITGFTSMNTQYGKKDVAMFTYAKGKKTIEGWFYLTNTLEHLKDFETPFDVIISKKPNKAGKREYWTSNKKTNVEYNNVHITDLIGETIQITDMAEIDTRYGKAYRVSAIVNDEAVDFLSSWEYLYYDLKELLDENFETIKDVLEADSLFVKVIEKKSKKSNRVYISYEDVD